MPSPKLLTVGDYVQEARHILMDKREPYRYGTDVLRRSLSLAILEASRLRPDLFRGRMNDLPSYDTSLDDEVVEMDPQYRMTLVYYIAGNTYIGDEEQSSETRASAFKNKFLAQLITIAS